MNGFYIFLTNTYFFQEGIYNKQRWYIFGKKFAESLRLDISLGCSCILHNQVLSIKLSCLALILVVKIKSLFAWSSLIKNKSVLSIIYCRLLMIEVGHFLSFSHVASYFLPSVTVRGDTASHCSVETRGYVAVNPSWSPLHVITEPQSDQSKQQRSKMTFPQMSNR